VIGVMRRPPGSDRRREVMRALDGLEAAVARLARPSRPAAEDPGPSELAGRVAAVRTAVERLHEADQAERHRLGHDLRSPLNAIAGWTHVLRLDTAAGPTARHAADVFDRSVRALTQLIEAYTTVD
jgi:signal transduction histidine kinase